MRPPARYDDASFEAYRPETPSQETALEKAQKFVRLVRVRYQRPGWFGLQRRRTGLRGGLYLVGPVGTGKTHLLAAIYRALHDPPDDREVVPCAFTHSSALFRSTRTPEAYADGIAEQARVLLIDEVELDDPASEVRLIGVLKALRERKVTIAATSNAEPDQFIAAQHGLGRERLQRFIAEEFEQKYHVIFVGGDDYRERLDKPGTAWIGPGEATGAAMQAHFAADDRPKRWLTLGALLDLATHTERTALAAELGALGALYLEGLAVDDPDTALRLLRILDDLYGQDEPPVLYFTARTEPRAWFSAAGRRGVEAGIAEKFDRTASRLVALAELVHLGPEAEEADAEEAGAERA